ncbi:MAG: hypothetical protein AAF417_18515 [Pseudomonadota bacterium]
MSRFEYLSVLISIVIALGISEITIAWGRVFQQRVRTNIYWLHAFWSLFSLFLLIQAWWGFWRYRTVEAWSLGGLTMAISVVVVLSFSALMLVPRPSGDGNIDSRVIYFQNAPKFFGFGACFVFLVTTMDVLLLGSELLHVENLFRSIGFSSALLMIFAKNETVHAAFAIVSIALLAGFLATATFY